MNDTMLGRKVASCCKSCVVTTVSGARHAEQVAWLRDWREEHGQDVEQERLRTEFAAVFGEEPLGWQDDWLGEVSDARLAEWLAEHPAEPGAQLVATFGPA